MQRSECEDCAEYERIKTELALIRKQRDKLAWSSSQAMQLANKDIAQTKEDAALVVHALNCALQLTEALIAYMPEGTSLHPGVATAKGALDQAMAAIRRKQP